MKRIKIPPLLLLISLIITSSDCNHDDPESPIVHYDEFCLDSRDKMSVVFKKFTGEQQCVCFDGGVYEYHESKDPKSPLCTLTPTRFHVPEFTCVYVTSTTTAITRLSEKPESDLHTHVTAHFRECNGEAHSRGKRSPQGPNGPVGPVGPGGPGPGVPSPPLDKIDEDFSSSGTEIGSEIMRAQMNQYIESVIAKLTGLQGEGGGMGGGGGGRHKYPVVKLMEYTKQIMQKTCTVVNPDFFDLALNSFVNLQLETYHIKEPYIGYSAYKRIEQAMTRCLQRATPHTFVTEENQPPGAGTDTWCDNHIPTKSSNQTVIHSGTAEEEVKNITIPTYASSELEKGKIAEPLIESVWKMLVSAHSYCYMYFSDYFNDHHTYTVALLPLFTNEIQDVWLNEKNGAKGYDLSDPEKTKLYGGLLGDVIEVLKDVDLCVGASRAISPYPWFMNRPLRDNSNGWNRRKKRDAGDEDAVSSATGKLVTSEQVVLHECKEFVGVDDVCRG